ncbi:MAG: hypothetical protein A2749_02005 [Parcubacteria group bacterium RIFCSPHIGHO2_01_FULL_45_26]|nr:MAG: hypothetical protein A2749_02005 [Parcubacteria group bacterium RIFCSPHIGHO2_01_FULL_45_26]
MNSSLKFIVLILLAVTFLLPFFSAQNFSAASDEITHLPSGYSYWKTGLIQLNPQHPPLVKLLAAFPLLFMDLKFDQKNPSLSGPLKGEWQFGQNFLFANNADQLLFWGRLPVMFLSLLLGFYVFKWASEMFSPKAGLLALFIYALMPAIIASAQFVTTDLPVAAFSFITLYYLWKFFTPNLSGTRSDLVPLVSLVPTKTRHLVFCGLFLGLALSSKFSAVLLFPIIVLLLLVYFWSKEGEWEGKMSQAIKWLAALFALSFGVVYLTYLMPLDFSFYLKGLKTVYADWGSNYKFYLNGHFSAGGWWYYFPLAFLMKTPLPVLIVLALVPLFYKKYRWSFKNSAFIFIPIIIFGFIISWKAGNISLRYLLPIYPFLILYAAGLAVSLEVSLATLSRVWRTLAGLFLTGLAGWYIWSTVSIYPDFLAYFNETVGGPKNGYKYLDDSNLEWGQDLKRLDAYQKQHPETKVLYSWDYTNPSYYGIQNILPKEPASFQNPTGRYAVNIHFLVRLQELSQRFNNKNMDWLSLYQPVGRIGYSFLVYEF